MGIKIVAKIEQEFNEEKRQWEAEVTPTLIQTFEGYYTCSEELCERGTLHEDDLVDDHEEGTSGRCPGCGRPVDHKEETRIDLGITLYEASSVCEVNSAVETNMLMLQRRCEEEGENLRQAEEDLRVERVKAEEQEAEELDDLRELVAREEGLSEDRHGGLISRKAHERLAKRKEEQRAKPEPEAG